VREGKSEELRKQVIDIALRHGLVSRYTSLVAVDPMPVRATMDDLHKTPVANNLPAGSQQNIQGLGFPRGATDSRLHMLFGVLALLLAVVLITQRQRYEK
jgi:Ca-activated chloride channel family protein